MYDEMHHEVRAPKPWIRWLLLLVILTATLVIGYALGSMQSQSEAVESSSTVDTDTSVNDSGVTNTMPTLDSNTVETRSTDSLEPVPSDIIE